jgi:ABC-2 type transport system ATP-binding protein
VNAETIKDEILELNKKGATILFSTHRMESVEELCDSIALLNKSKKILDGTVKSIRNSYRNATYVIEYNGAQVILDGRQPFEIIEETTGNNNDHSLKIRLNDAVTSNDALQYLIPKAQINMLEEVIPSMNEIFIENVNKIA